MAIAYRNATTAVDDDATLNSKTLTINVPSGVVEDDVMLAFVASETTGGITMPENGSWTTITADSWLGGDDTSYVIQYKVAGPSEPASYDWGAVTATELHGGIVAFSGVDTTTPLDQTSAFSKLLNTTDPDSPTITTQTAGAEIVALLMTTRTLASVTPPTGYTKVMDAPNGNTSRRTAVAHLVKATAGATGTINWPTSLASFADPIAGTIALKPSGASGASITDLGLVNLSSTAQASLSGLKWSWFDQSDPNNFTAPTDQGLVESTDGSGNISISMPNSTLTTGQTGFLVLRDPANNYIGGYRVAVD